MILEVANRELSLSTSPSKRIAQNWWFSFLALCILAFWIQTHLYLHKDVAIISHSALQLWQGQTYLHDIFDPNPPLIFYLHIIPILLSKLSGISLLDTLRAYILLLISISMLCLHSMIKIMLVPSQRIANIMLCSGLAYILLFLPAEAFGQREHLYLILTLPYLFLANLRIQSQPIHPLIALFIGCLAGIGFAIKPFFLISLCMLELFLINRSKRPWEMLRIESITCTSIILVYGLSVIYFQPEYLQIVVPFWMPYYRGITQPCLHLLTLSFIWCCASIVIFFFQKHSQRDGLPSILMVCIIGNIATYVIPQVNWYYHILPALSLAFLYFILVFSELGLTIKHINDRIIVGGLAGIIFFLPIGQSILRIHHAITYFHTNNAEKRLMTLLGSYPNHNRYMFFSMTHNLYDLEFYSSAQNVGSMSFCNWEYIRLGSYSSTYQDQIRSYALSVMTHDLNMKKPEFVIVDVPSSRTYLKQEINFPIEFDRNKPFHGAWSHYVYQTTIAPYDIYRRLS